MHEGQNFEYRQFIDEKNLLGFCQSEPFGRGIHRNTSC
jgi:hypothetical protein